MIRDEIKKLIENSVRGLQKGGVFSEFEIPEILVEKPTEKTHGDYSTNIVLKLVKLTSKNPMEIAGLIKEHISKVSTKPLFENIEVVRPGFINFYIFQKVLVEELKRVLKEKKEYGKSKIGKNQKINIEFISANPTGPLTLGNGRGGFCGDVLANVLEEAGYKVTREYYINDTGEQIKKLGHSVLGDEQAVYKGKYIDNLRKKLLGRHTSQYSVEEVGEKAAQIILKEMIKPTVKRMGIKFDVWFSENSLYEKKEVDKAIEELKKKNLTYEKDGALWFRSTQFGDDKDRVLVKKDGEKTYITPDIAYFKNKFKRGFKKLIFFWGADHYGYIGRIKAAIESLGFKKESADFIIMQLVKLFEKGKEVRMSKRAGIYVTLDELLDEVGLDVARFFFLTRNSDSHLNFDLDLAKKQSKDNPVFYVQYAHARICAILRKCGKSKTQNPNFKLLNHPAELGLIKQLILLPEIIEDTTKDYQVQRFTQYATELADAFHQFYENCRVISDDKNLTQARLSLILATKTVLENTLDLMGISAPEKM